MKDKLMNLIKKGQFKTKKYTPEIMLGVGIAAGIGSVISAYNVRPKIDDILKESEEKKEKVNEYVTNNGFSEKYTEKDHSKDLTLMGVKTTVDIAKAFGPTVTLGLISITCILTSHNIMYKRSAALAAAYELTRRGFNSYRDKIIEKFGEELDKDIIFNTTEEEVEEIVVDKDGKEKIKKSKVKVPGDMMYSQYARCFDPTSWHWKDDATYNRTFLEIQQRYANDLLIERGYVYLNDVYKLLGFEETKAGQVVGWVYDPDGTKHGNKWPKGSWDNYITFNIYDINSEANRRFVNGYENCIWLDFNVDGNIWNLME